MDEFKCSIATVMPAAVLLNYRPMTLGWADDLLLTDDRSPRFALIHEANRSTLDRLKPGLVDFLRCPDPTVLPWNPQVITVSCSIPCPRPESSGHPEVLTVGSFGFATPSKGLERLCGLVNAEFEHSLIRLHLPPHDNESIVPRGWFYQLVDACHKRITKPGIAVAISKEFLDEAALLDFFRRIPSTPFSMRFQVGISSCKDYALASGRPITVSGSVMFRKLHYMNPSIAVEICRMGAIAAARVASLRHHIKHYATEAASHAGCDAILVALELRDCSGLGDAGDRLYGTK